MSTAPLAGEDTIATAERWIAYHIERGDVDRAAVWAEIRATHLELLRVGV